MLELFVGGEQEIDEISEGGSTILCVNMSSNEAPVSPEDMMESVIDKLLGMSSFLDNNRDVYGCIEASFYIEIPEGHDSAVYEDVQDILRNMEHQKLVEWYEEYLSDSFEDAVVESGLLCLYFTVYPPEKALNEAEMQRYYQENIL